MKNGICRVFLCWIVEFVHAVYILSNEVIRGGPPVSKVTGLIGATCFAFTPDQH